MSFTLKLSQKALLLIAVPLVSEGAFLLMLTLAFDRAKAEADSQIHSKSVLTDIDQILICNLDGAKSLLQYNRSKGAERRKEYEGDIVKGENALASLKALTDTNAEDYSPVHEIEGCWQEAKAIGTDILAQMDEHKDDFERGSQLTLLQFRILGVSARLKRAIQILEKMEDERAKHVSHAYRDALPMILLAGFLLNVVVALALAVSFMRTTASRLKVLTENTVRLTSNAPLNEPLQGSDELKQIDQVFHLMVEALQEAARKERAVIDNAVDVICSIDEKLTFYACSPASTNVFGYEPEEMLGMRLVQIVVPEDFEKTRKEFERVKQDLQKPFFEFQVKRKDGGIADLRCSAHWSTTEKSFYCVASDITARREVERLKQEFISMMSHDLRTPLMSIQASLALLSAGASGELQPSAARHVEDAERNIAYIISLINSMIDVERMDTAKLQIHTYEHDLAEVMETAIQAVRSLAANKGIQLVCQSIEVNLEFDADRIVQVLINLISNALKFSPRGTTITVEAKVLAAEVEICVADQGRGIPEGDLPSVFERFKQVEEADAREKKGSGLGLAICKAIVEAHGGTIGAESRLGEGTTFWFRLPAPPLTVSGAASAAAAAEGKSKT